jgi:hypothetical protein
MFLGKSTYYVNVFENCLSELILEQQRNYQKLTFCDTAHCCEDTRNRVRLCTIGVRFRLLWYCRSFGPTIEVFAHA